MPDDLERLLRISELDGGDIGEVVVLLRGIIVQLAHDLCLLYTSDAADE